MGVYLAEKALTFDTPTGTADKVFQPTTPATGLNSPTEINWGTVQLDEGGTAAGDGVFSIYLTTRYAGTPTANARLSMIVNVYVKPPEGTEKKYVGATSMSIGSGAATTAPAAAQRYVAAVNMKGAALPAGSTIRVGLVYYSSSVPADVDILYGHAARPSGIRIPFLGDGPAEAPTATSTSPATGSASPTPSANASAGPSPSPTPTATTSVAPPSNSTDATTSPETVGGPKTTTIGEDAVIPSISWAAPAALALVALLLGRFRR